MIGFVSDIKRMTVHDGPGIRTTIFLKGCPLQCLWCHNPENLTMEPTLYFTEKLCIGCGDCVSVCRNACHQMIDGKRVVEYKDCQTCGKCVDACLSCALTIYGEEMTAEAAASRLSEDKCFFDQSGGGVTFSGGEPLMQSSFVADILKRLKKDRIHTAIDTCGEVPWSAFEEVLPYTDLFLFDVKHIDADPHQKGTGTDNVRILDNLSRLNENGVPMEIRTPVIPGYNDSLAVLESIARLLSDYKNITAWRLLPYNSMARGKYEALGMVYPMPDIDMPDVHHMQALKEQLREIYPHTKLASDQ